MIDLSKEIPNPSQFWSLKKHNESFGIATIPKADMIFRFSVSYLTKNFFKTRQSDNYCKLVWLTSQYYKTKRFNFLIGAIWNPTNDKWEIHPGGGRQIPIYYFGNEMQECLCFNTNGKEVEFTETFESFDDIKKKWPRNHLRFVVCKDFNTVTPHLQIDTNKLQDYKNTYFKLIDKFYKHYSITANFDLTEYGYDNIDSKKSTCKVEIKTNKGKDKAFMLMPIVKYYEDSDIKITRLVK